MNKLKLFKQYIHHYFKSMLLVWKTSAPLTLGMITGAVLQAISPALGILLANNLLNTIKSSTFSHIILLVILWGSLFVINNILTPLNLLIQGWLTDKLTFKINKSLMDKSAELQTIDFFENSEFYDNIQIISSEASWRPVNLIVFATSILSNIVMLGSMLILLASFSSIISILIIISLIPQGIVFYKVQKQAFEILVSNSSESRKLDYYSNIVLSSKNIKDVRLYNAYNFFEKKYTEVFQSIVRNVQKNRIKQFFISSIFLFVTAIISVISFIYVIKGIQKGIFETGAIFVFSSSIIYSIQNVSRIVEEGSLLYDTLLYMQKYFDFLNLKNHSTEKKLPFKKSFNQIIFKNVSFKYPNSSKIILNNLNFAINKGEKIAIVGENGSGKSTIIKLLCRFYKLEEGHIFFDETNYLNFNIEEYRNNLSAVFQDFSTFDLTIRENIAISDFNNYDNDDKIINALKKSGFNNIQLNKILGKQFGGEDLSGGEWQKIAISRAFFRDSEILFLDEPTASIDAKTEYKIYSDFLKLTKNKTVIFITHKLATVKKADKILLLKNGEILDFENHEKLIKNNLYYKDLYEMQASTYIS